MKLLTEATVNPLSVTATWLSSAPAGTVGVVTVGVVTVGVVVGRGVEETLVMVVYICVYTPPSLESPLLLFLLPRQL